MDSFTLMVAELYYGNNLLNSIGEKDYLSIVENRLLKGYIVSERSLPDAVV